MNYKITDRELLKIRTNGTADMVLSDVSKIDLPQLLADVFVYTDNSLAKYLIREYETQLILASSDSVKFKLGLHKFFLNTANYIKEHNLYKEFLSFFYFTFSTFSIKENISEKKSIYAYYDLLAQQIQYFTPQLSRTLCGLNSDGKPMLINDPYPYIDVPMTLCVKFKKNSLSDRIKFNKMYGYDVSNSMEIMKLGQNDQVITNNIFIMSNFINEETFHLVPKNFYMIMNGLNVPRITVPTEQYKELLKEKRYFLPNNGIRAIYKNTHDIKEVFYQEIFSENRIMLLYKLVAKNNTEFYGFFDNKLKLFYSPFMDISPQSCHLRLENFILETYLYLTIDTVSIGLENRLSIVDDFENTTIKSPMVQFLYEEEDTHNNKRDIGSERHYKSFNKENYMETVKQIHPFKRRLPEGCIASEEALRLAKEYGYAIYEGETFVKPFEKKVYKKHVTIDN